MTADLLTERQLNRATLDRQLLLQRSGMGPLDGVAHLVGMQAQLPLNPYLALGRVWRSSTRRTWDGCWATAQSCGPR